jgi:hypothetical protein
VGVSVGLGVEEVVSLGVDTGVPLNVVSPEGVTLDVGDLLGVPVRLGVRVLVSDIVGVLLGVAELEGVCVWVPVILPVTVRDIVGVLDGEGGILLTKMRELALSCLQGLISL